MERNKNADDGYLAKDVRGHVVAMSGEFVGTFMFLYFAFAATQIASTSNLEAHILPLGPMFDLSHHNQASARASAYVALTL